jgi:hypothetical protein
VRRERVYTDCVVQGGSYTERPAGGTGYDASASNSEVPFSLHLFLSVSLSLSLSLSLCFSLSLSSPSVSLHSSLSIENTSSKKEQGGREKGREGGRGEINRWER